VKGWRFPKRRISGTKWSRSWTWLARALACTCLFGSLSIHAAQTISLNDPIGFFTNVASRLLQSELGVDLNRIQIYPTNQYTPSVHRLLQVTANLYDVATNRPVTDYPFVPSVFRPLFTNDGGAIYICGYAEETGTNLLNAAMRDVADPADRAALQATDMVYGVPAIVGAKKGWPNFNEFGLQNDAIVSRTLVFHRVGSTLITNQVYTIGISNAFGVEAWNSYSAIFARPLQMFVKIDVIMSVTNQVGIPTGPDGQPLSNIFSASIVTNITPTNWAGFTSPSSAVSFIVPLFTNYLFLTNSSYVFTQNAFTTGADPANFFPNLQLSLNANARVRFALVDSSVGRIVDFVNLSSSETPVIVGDLLKRTDTGSDATCDGNFNGAVGSFFCTNRPTGLPSAATPTYGILNQFWVSMGSPQVSDSFWASYNAQAVDKNVSIQQFRNRILGTDTTPDFVTPFNPRRTIHHYISWQANDPLVHYQIQDLSDLLSAFKSITFDQDTTLGALIHLGGIRPLNDHYRPWAGNPLRIADTSPPTAKNFTLKDPQISKSDSWNFPTNPYPSLDWVGKVHRGTPWQTLFLKSTNTDLITWQLWSGLTNVTEAQLTMPTNDWHVASLLVSMLNTNDPHHLFSLNQPNSDARRAVLDGLTVMTNTGPLQFDTLVISSNSPQAAFVGTALDEMRASQPDKYFRDVGDILATPELSIASPWLNTIGGASSGITDEAYEKIPAQLLPLLRPDSIGLVTKAQGGLHVRFSGIDGLAYGVQISSNLFNWTTVSTNYPMNGFFEFVDTPLKKLPTRFCRSVLLP
jgi:hypothetical protein